MLALTDLAQLAESREYSMHAFRSKVKSPGVVTFNIMATSLGPSAGRPNEVQLRKYGSTSYFISFHLLTTVPIFKEEGLLIAS